MLQAVTAAHGCEENYRYDLVCMIHELHCKEKDLYNERNILVHLASQIIPV